jgi:outer membrane protein assembly factor BamB
VASSPAVANGVVYVGSEEPDSHVYALNAATGAQLWAFSATIDFMPSPAVANGVVYVGADDGNLYALNAATGAQLWAFATGDVDSSPAVANGVVYVGSDDGNLYAFDLHGGMAVSPEWPSDRSLRRDDGAPQGHLSPTMDEIWGHRTR